ncbi:MAG: TonB-dependent receptor plug domain-containing protein [Bacteroidales bacterium]
MKNLDVTDLVIRSDSVKMNVVSASRSNKNADELPITIYTITRDEILRNQYVSLTDVLKRLPGIRVSQPGSGELGEVYQVRD